MKQSALRNNLHISQYFVNIKLLPLTRYLFVGSFHFKLIIFPAAQIIRHYPACIFEIWRYDILKGQWVRANVEIMNEKTQGIETSEH